jgi:hypothetical protein
MNLLDYIAPELLILIPVLYLIGMGLKRSSYKDELIPVTLGAAGVLLSIIWVLATSDLPDVKSVFAAIFTGLTQGVLCAGAAVFANQLYKQAKK